MDHQLDWRVQALRIAFGLTATLAGLDKFFNILADWSAYVSPLAAQLLPVSPGTFMYGVGVIEFAVGIAILFTAPVIGATRQACGCCSWRATCCSPDIWTSRSATW